MGYGEHVHNYPTVVKAELIIYDTGKELIEIYKQCDCGRVWKDTQHVNEKRYDT